MAEYIDREALLARLQIRLPGRGIASEGINQVMDVCCDEIKKHPAADVEEVKHGRWIKKIGRVMCSVCADECWSYSAMEYNHSPNCGAKMDVGKENEIE